MIPIRDNQKGLALPVVTYTLIGLNILIYLWDRNLSPFGQSATFADLAMRPRDVVDALTIQGADRFPLVTIFTAMFLHGSVLHIVGNLLYLLVFGTSVESALGAWRYALYYLFWGVVAAAAQIFVDPASQIPTIGASGAIGGVLGAYFLLFPTNRIEIIIPFMPIPFVVSAWVLLGTWFLYQLVVRQPGVATWAHAGGFMAGMLTVLIMGGRSTVLKGREKEFEADDEFD
ncbi:MAG: rhomboid family intramembrane serine protease [Fimbriimonadaceae bacterium]|nr:rhomboid family intramembrane serine protease [Fimbriimonadaceae bacterium]